MTLNDLECPIHLKVRSVDGTLDVDLRTLWLSYSTIRIGGARGGGGERAAGGRSPPPPCGQLTRCFSAVAELLVLRVSAKDLALVIEWIVFGMVPAYCD